MHLELQDGLVALTLILAVATMLAIAPALRVPYPILLVLGGLAIGVVPGMPQFDLDPELVFFGVLPPLLYSSAFFTSLRELRSNVRPIGLLALGLVLATTVGVAVVAHAFIDGLSWPSAFVLGAIVSPTDPLAASSIARRFGVPARLVTIVEGESLVNDGTGLVLYRVAVAAVITGSFSALYTGGLFLVTAGGGIAFGLLVGWLVRQIRRRLDNPPAEITISLLTGYVAFIPADLMGVSAVLATVTAGVYLGWHTPELTSAQVRLQGRAVWEIVQYLLNALLFVLIGLQLPVVLDALGDVPALRLLALRRPREPDRDSPALRLGVRRAPCPEGDRETRVELASRRLRLLGRNAWRRVTRGRSRPAPRDRRRLRVSRTGTHSLPHVLGHPGDAGRDGTDHATRHPQARARGRRRRVARGREGSHSRCRSGVGAARGARGGGLGA